MIAILLFVIVTTVVFAVLISDNGSRTKRLERRIKSLEDFIKGKEASVTETKPVVYEPQYTPPPTPPVISVAPPVIQHIAPQPQVVSMREEAISQLAALKETTPAKASSPSFEFNWEQFLGVKLFAWIGGIIFFLAVAFALKYSFERNLISPEIRMSMGALLGIALVVGGAWPKPKHYEVLSHTLCATGIVILYAGLFASNSLYHLIPPLPTFILMSVVTAAAFSIAVALDGQFVAILGLLGGFLTPILLGSDQDHAVGLFSYILLLNVGLALVVLRKHWNYLMILAAIGTGIMEIAWCFKFYADEKIWTLFTILTVFQVGYTCLLHRQNQKDLPVGWHFDAVWIHGAVMLLLCGIFLIAGSHHNYPIAQLLGMAIVSASVFYFAWQSPRWYWVHSLCGIFIFLVMGIWIYSLRSPVGDSTNFMASSLPLVLGFDLLFALFHCAGPAILQKVRGAKISAAWTQVFPIIAMLLLFGTMDYTLGLSPLIWATIIAVDLIGMFLTLIFASYRALAVLIAITLFAVGSWITNSPLNTIPLADMTLMVGGFALVLFLGSIYVIYRYLKSIPSTETKKMLPLNVIQLPALSAALPFILLAIMVDHLKLANPTPVFLLTVLLSVMLLGTAKWLRNDWLGWVALGGAWITQLFWQQSAGDVGLINTNTALCWNIFFFALFLAYPFVFKKEMLERPQPWLIACGSGLLHFILVYLNVKEYHAELKDYMGIIPAAFVLPYLAAFAYFLRTLPQDYERRNGILALFGGTTLFFVTLIFPIQLSNEWFTIAWALEGAALIWLSTRIRYPKLWMIGCALLAVAFVRLTFNPAILEYHTRSEIHIWNWYLYTYGLVIVSMFTAVKLLKDHDYGKIDEWNFQAIAAAGGTILLFLLMNIEIADYFATGSTLTFDFSGNLPRDMAYSIGWAVFAIGLLIFGILHKAKAARYASIGLFGVTVLKIFFHDITELDALYRIGALLIVAVLLIVSSFLYQKFAKTFLQK